jgi:hypothetical protein
MDIQNLTRDIEGISAGQWVGDLPGCDDARVRVRGMTSPVVRTLRSRKERQAPKDDRERDGSLTDAARLRITREVLHEAVLLDWDGFTSGGQVLPYSADMAGKLLLDPKLERFADIVAYAANIVDNSTAEKVEVLAKNSPKASPGA